MPAVLHALGRWISEQVGEQAGADAFDEIALAPGPSGNADVELHAPRIFPATHQFLERLLDQTECARDVVCRAGGQHGDGNAAPDHAARDLRDRAVASRNDDESGVLLQRALPALFLRRTVAHLVAARPQQLAQPRRVARALLSRARVVDQRDAHANCWSKWFTGESPCASSSPTTTASTVPA